MGPAQRNGDGGWMMEDMVSNLRSWGAWFIVEWSVAGYALNGGGLRDQLRYRLAVIYYRRGAAIEVLDRDLGGVDAEVVINRC